MSAPAVIIGASHAGVQAAVSLRQAGWQERIVLLSAEKEHPYHRPPLSKAFLAGEKEEEQLLLRAPDFYTDQEIELRLGDPALSIDAVARVVTSRTDTFSYGKLVLATGSRARQLAIPGGGAEGVHTLRSLADARSLKVTMAEASSIVIIGGGFIGLEFASTAAKLGKDVVVVEAQAGLLSRSLPTVLGEFIRDQHAAKGVRFIFQARLEAFELSAGRVCAVRLADGRLIEADMVLLGVGGEAELSLARSIGLVEAAGGIGVDAHGRAGIPDIYAIGDVAGFHNAYATGPMRLESVQNAVDQAKAAAAHMTGGDSPLRAVPWFWTDQYALKVQMAGLSRPNAVEIRRGDPAGGAFTILQTCRGRLVAAYSVNRAADHMAARKLIADGALIHPGIASDVDIPLTRALEPA